LLCFFFFISSALASTPVLCGNYGPRYFINIGTSFQATAIFATPLSTLSDHPYFFGCTPKSVTGPNNVSASFQYYSASVFISKASYLYLGLPTNTIQNTFIPYQHDYPWAVATSSMTGKPFIQLSMSMEYGGTNDNLRSITVTGPKGQAILMPFKKFLPYLEVASEEEALVTLDYGNPVLPYHATNITISQNGTLVIMAYLTFFTFDTGEISKIEVQESIHHYHDTYDFLYNSNKQLISECSAYNPYCIEYTYDSSGRIINVSSNNQTLNTFTYNMVNGISQINSTTDSFGTYIFHY